MAAGVVVLSALLYFARSFERAADESSAAKDVGRDSAAHRADSVSSPTSKAANRMADYPTAESLKERVRKAIAANKYQELSDSLSLLAHVDPLAAASLAASAGGLRADAVGWVVGSWVEDDPYAVLEWAGSLTDSSMGDERASAVCSACMQIAKINPEDALALLGKYGIRSDAIIYNLIVTGWAAKDFDAAEAWAAARPPAIIRSQIFVSLVTKLAETDPEGAIDLLRKEIPTGLYQGNAVIEVVLQWAPHDRAAAAAWVATFPPGELKQNAERALDGKRPPSPPGWD